jgi:hypothetical protein
MTDSKSEIVVYQGPDKAGLVAQAEPVTARWDRSRKQRCY